MKPVIPVPEFLLRFLQLEMEDVGLHFGLDCLGTLAQRPLLPIQRPCPKHFAIALFALAMCVETVAFQQPVKTPLEFAQSGGKTTPDSTLQSKSGFFAERLPSRSAQLFCRK